MSSRSDSSLSPEVGQLLDLLNASEAQGGGAVEDFTALECPVAGDQGDQNQLDSQAARLAELAEAMRAIHKRLLAGHTENLGGEITPSIPADETLSLGVENPETRYAAHIVQGMRKIKKDQAG